MALLYGWKKEYLFEKMSWAQIIMYFKYGTELKYGKPKPGEKKPASYKHEDVKAELEQLKKQYGAI